ncbi:MAG: TadE family protein [Myxococcaceae bacterium]
MMRRPAKGQATLELALGSLVMVTILLAGLYFGEVVFGSMKVQEAANSALWDVTHYKHHNIAGLTYSTAPIGTAVDRAQADTSAAYQDFDGRTSVNKGSNLTHALTATNGMTVRCTRGGAPGFTPNPLVAWSFNDNSGVSCSAEADFLTVNMPESFADSSAGELFQARHWTRASLHVCATGRGAACNGRYSLMVDDWGLTGPNSGEWLVCPGLPYGIPCPTNPAYWWTTYKGYLTSYYINGAFKPVMFSLPASMLAMSVSGLHPMGGIDGIGGMPWNESTFYMSYTGPLPLFNQYVFGPREGWPVWETNPFLFSMMPYSTAYFKRFSNGGCYLGTKC